MRYFAYGSNMSPVVMAAECPAHSYLGAACLTGRRLTFTRRSTRTGTGVADIVHDPGNEVWGALYELGDGDLAALDRKEGLGVAYARETVTVTTSGGELLSAETYTVIAKEPADVRPSAEYAARMLAAGAERRLPDAHMAALELLIGGLLDG